VRSERAFCEELDYNLLRWFLDMQLMEPRFDATTFTKNRQRLLDHEVGRALFELVVGQAHERDLLSDEHFTVDGTLIEAAASSRASSHGTASPRTPPTMIRATRRWTSMERSAPTPPIRARPTRQPA
jgi:transposase